VLIICKNFDTNSSI